MKVAVLGAGHAGLIAAQMLRRELFDVTVFEKQFELPLNHASVLRFRTDALQKALGVPLKKVRVLKDVIDTRGIIPDALNYAKKVTGTYRTDRSVPLRPEAVERYVHHGNLSEHLSQGLNIKYGIDFASPALIMGFDAVISTIPMDAAISDIEPISNVEFSRTYSTCITATLKGVDAYLSAYVIDPNNFIARISVTGSLIQIDLDQSVEDVTGPDVFVEEAAMLIGALDCEWVENKVHTDINSKLTPIDERERKRIIMKLTDAFRIYSVGRQATWRPNLLLDDVVEDVRKVIMMLRGYPNTLVDRKEYNNA